MITLNDIIDIAKNGDGDPIDFGMISIDENLVFQHLALAIYKAYSALDPKLKEAVFLAAILNLQVKNFVLTQQLQESLSTIERLKK
jgi:hypothetical protein